MYQHSMDFGDNRDHPGFRKSGLIGTDANREPEDNVIEEKTPLHVPPELAELFISDTEDEKRIQQYR